MRRGSLVVLTSFAVWSCASVEPPEAVAPNPPDPIAVMESLAVEAERQVNLAERALDALQPEVAEVELARAKPQVEDPRIDGYPDTVELRRRLEELTLRVPEVRAEIARRELAARVEAARARVDEARNKVDAYVSHALEAEVDETDLTKADEAIAGLKAALDESTGLEAEDPEYEAYALTLRKEAAEKREQVAERRRALAVEEGRRAIERGLLAVDEHIERLGMGEPEAADFEATQAAVASAAAILEDRGALRDLDPHFAAFALAARGKIEAAQRTIKARRIEVDVAVQRRAIDGARASLTDALGRLGDRWAGEAEVETATHAMAHLEEILRGQGALGAKDAAFRRYLGESERALKSARRDLERGRSQIGVARASERLRAAIESVAEHNRRKKTELDIEATESAVEALTRTIAEGATLRRKDKSYAELSARAQKVASQAKDRVAERRAEISAEAQRTRVRERLDALKGTLATLDFAAPNEDAFRAATDAIASAKEALREGAALERKDPRYRTYASSARDLLQKARLRMDERRLDLKARETKTPVQEALVALEDAVRDAKKADASREDVKKGNEILLDLRQALSRGTSLEARHPAYQKLAAAARKTAAQAKEELDVARDQIAFREGPVATLVRGKSALDARSASREEDKQSYTTAMEHFMRCRSDAASILSARPRLASTVFKVGRVKMKGKNVLSTCTQSVTAAKEKVAKVNAILAFYAGPARSFESGKALLEAASGPTDAKKRVQKDALSHFEACLESGRSLEYRHPEFKRARIDLSGEKVTLPALVAACERQAKTLRNALARR